MSKWYGPCTWNNAPEDAWLQLSRDLKPNWILGQREVASTGTPHCQFLVYFANNVKATTLVSKMKPHKIFWGKGKPAAAAEDIITYVTKLETAIPDSKFEFGKKPKINSSKEELFQETLDLVKKGSIREVNAEHLVKYTGNLLKLEGLFSQPYEADHLRGIWFYGPPGAGKSRAARAVANGQPFYDKPQSKWWDLYKGQKYVILDNLDRGGECLFHYLQIWSDRYSFVAEFKGGALYPQHDWFIVTSNFLPEDLWTDKEVLGSIRRRFDFRKVGDQKPSDYISSLCGLLL